MQPLEPHIIRPVAPADETCLRQLAGLLVDAVEDGAAVSFLAPLALDQATDWWRRQLSGAHPRAVFLAARDDDGLTGTVHLQPAWAPNQPHRAELCKLIVHRRARGRGLGRALMLVAERAAAEAGFTLLTLDAKRGGAAEHLYRSLGWTCVGSIPGYAVDTDGQTPHDAVIFYKNPVRACSGVHAWGCGESASLHSP